MSNVFDSEEKFKSRIKFGFFAVPIICCKSLLFMKQ